MANQEGPFSFNNNPNTGEKMPHAGDLPVEQGGERPLREFNTPLDQAVKHGYIETPDSTDHPALRDIPPATVTKEKTKLGWKKPAAAAALVAAAIGSAYGIGKASSPNEKTQPQSETPTSEVASPTEQDGPSMSDINTFESQGTATEIQGNFNYLLSKIVNERVVDSKGENDDDINYLASGEALDNLSDYVEDLTNRLTGARNKAEIEGRNNNIVLSTLYHVKEHSRSDSSNGFIVVSDTEYLLSTDDQFVGSLQSNLDRYQYRYEYTTLTLPDGSERETFILTEFEPITKRMY